MSDNSSRCWNCHGDKGIALFPSEHKSVAFHKTTSWMKGTDSECDRKSDSSRAAYYWWAHDTLVVGKAELMARLPRQSSVNEY